MSCMCTKPPSIRIPDEEAHTLNTEQRLVVESVLSGYNTFFTGPAGSGKSHILDHIQRLNHLDLEGRVKKKIVVTATTGLAACNIGGMTIHSFAGIGIGEGPIAQLISQVMGNKDATQRWVECDILVIDEISMMSAKLFDKLSLVASKARNNDQPFGGIQLVVCGDFYQLPPVKLKLEKFAFEAKTWPKVIMTSICLTQVFRQGQDEIFCKILNQARVGELSEDSISILRHHCDQSPSPRSYTDAVVGEKEKNSTSFKTLIECKNEAVNRLNVRELAKLPGKVQSFNAIDTGINERYKAQLKYCAAPEQLDLKVGAAVLLLKNLDYTSGLVNGSRGIVENLEEISTPKCDGKTHKFEKFILPRIRFVSSPESILLWPFEFQIWKGDQMVASRRQIPLKLGYALTVHKCQGMTIQDVFVNLNDTFEYGQAYVALSRATQLKSLSLKGFDPKHIKAHPVVQYFYCLLASASIQNHHIYQKSQNGIVSNKTSDSPLTNDQLILIQKNRREAEVRRSITLGLCPSLASLCISLSQNSDHIENSSGLNQISVVDDSSHNDDNVHESYDSPQNRNLEQFSSPSKRKCEENEMSKKMQRLSLNGFH